MDDIESHDFEVDGIKCHLRIAADYDVRPTDFECYSEADMAAWRNDDWRFVMFGVSVAALPDSVAWLGGIEWGHMPEAGWLTFDYYHTGNGRDILAGLADEARDNARKIRAEINTLPL